MDQCYELAADVLSREAHASEDDIAELAGDLSDFVANWLEIYRKDKANAEGFKRCMAQMRKAMAEFHGEGRVA